MRNALTAALAVLTLMSTGAQAESRDVPERTMPHQRECTVPLPQDFWDADGAGKFRHAEEWAWNAICLGQIADMRLAPDGDSDGKECSPAGIERTDEAVPGNRKLRPEFLELILGHEPWASVPRHPQVDVACALVDGDLTLDGHEINPDFGFFHGRIDGEVSLVGTEFERSVNLSGSTVTGTLNASSLKVGDNLLMNGGGMFAEIHLPNARIAGNVAFDGSTVTGLLNAEGIEVDGSLFLRDDAEFAGIRLLGARVTKNTEFDGSTVSGLLNASGLEVGNSLFCVTTLSSWEYI